MSLLKKNVAQNGLDNAVAEELDWFNPRKFENIDLVIGTDLVY